MVTITEKSLDAITEIALRKYIYRHTPRVAAIVEALHEYVTRNGGEPGFELKLQEESIHSPVEE